MESSAIIEHEGRELLIEFEYEKSTPATYEDDGEPGYFNIYSIRYIGKLKKDRTYNDKYRHGEGREIINLLSPKTKSIISEQYIRDNGDLF